MTALTETQTVILFHAINRNKDIIPSLAYTNLACDARAYGNAIAGLAKKGFAEVAGAATANDYSKGGWRYRVTAKGIEAFESDDDEEQVAKVEELQAELDEEDEDEYANLSGSRVKHEYKRVYAERKALGGSGQGCADALDQFMTMTFMRPAEKGNRLVLDVPAFASFALDNEINVAKYAGLNVGMIRMNVTNTLRARLRKGQNVYHNGEIAVYGAIVASKKEAQAIAA
jgi:hypothetical protein